MSALIFVEGGGDSNELRARCREGFSKLLARCGFAGRLPRLVACGGRNAAFDKFTTAHAGQLPADYVALLIDSEDPVADHSATWQHLERRDGWRKPSSADDEQVLLMTTCMETWIICDRQAIRMHYGARLETSALPTTNRLEELHRETVYEALRRATRNCSNAYAKGKRSFAVLAELDPSTLDHQLPSFRRIRDILGRKLC